MKLYFTHERRPIKPRGVLETKLTREMKDDKPTNKERVRLMLLSGKRLTKFFLDRYLQVTNSAELVRQLRKEMDIETVWKVSATGKRYGEYVYSPPPKVNRIKAGTYSRA